MRRSLDVRSASHINAANKIDDLVNDWFLEATQDDPSDHEWVSQCDDAREDMREAMSNTLTDVEEKLLWDYYDKHL